MFNDYHYAVMHDRALREQGFAERVAERNGYARGANRPSLRARMARRFFSLAVAAEREEAWRLAWGRLGTAAPTGSTSEKA